MDNIKNITDWELLTGDDGAFNALFNRYKNYVFRLAVGMTNNHHLADDITQDVFLRIYNKRLRLKENASFKTLIYRTTINTTNEFIRKERKETTIDYATYRQYNDNQTQCDDSQCDDIMTMVQQLPKRQRDTLLLRFFEKQSIRSIAEILECSEGNIKSQVHLAIKKLRQLFIRKSKENISAN